MIANIKLGNLYVEQGEYERARQGYQQALQTDRAVVDAEVSNLQQQAEAHSSAARYLCIGMILQQAGRKPEAISAYQRALRLDPTVGEARRSLQGLQTGK